MKYLVIILLLAWSSDASASADIDPLYIDIVREFEEDMVWKVNSTVTVAKITPPNILGFCQRSTKKIWLRLDTVSMPYIIRKAIIYHELGHCELGLFHTQYGDFTLTGPVIYINNPLHYELYWPLLVADLRMKYLNSLP